MNIIRTCEFCGNSFTAKKTTTRCCSDSCSKRAYKKRIKEQNLQHKELSYQADRKGFDIIEVQKKEYLSVKEAMFLLNVSRMTIFRMIKDRRLSKLTGLKAVRVRRSDIDKLFNTAEPIAPAETQARIPDFSLDNYYSINQVLENFGVSNGAFYNLCKKHDIPKFRRGKFVYVPQKLVDKIFEE